MHFQEVRILKKFIHEFFGHFFANPLLPLLVIVGSVSAMLFTGDGPSEQLKSDAPDYIRTSVPLAVSSSSETATTTTDTSVSTTSTTTAAPFTVVTLEAETTTTALTTTATADEDSASSDGSSTESAESDDTPDTPAGRPQVSPYTVYVGADSPNSGYYQDRLVIFGDSIAYGFNAYGYIPREHNVAAESMALWNMSRYTFDLGGGAMSPVDAAIYSDSPLIYISIGVNDVSPNSSADNYATGIYSIAQQIVNNTTDVTVVIGSITPVAAVSQYPNVSNDIINSFNNALENTVNANDSPQILFFDANAVLSDPNTGYLASNVNSGDGLHLMGAAYGYWLNALFNYLDTTDTLDRIAKHDSKYE
ncbi:MAG: hypothetical protein IKG98_07580 [Ruminococcus sp.]|nr:hypothetical protein [Ruminococcus sp.]